jgi:peptidoglycan/LPS O-acetylase OafA/YrhL
MTGAGAPATKVPSAGSHVPILDGVRGVALLMGLCVHFIGDAPAYTTVGRVLVKLANYGIWGVDLFFVLSGFLITGLLYDSKSSPRYFRNFYVRRTLRIFPLYYGVLAALFIVLPALPVPYPAGLDESARHQGWLWLYVSNAYLAIRQGWALPYVGHFWSLAVEEQFYLVWPIVVLTLGRRSLLGACVAVTGLALGLRCALSFAGAGDIAVLVLTPCRFDALCIGGFVALAVRSVGLERVARTARRCIGPFAGLVLLASAWNALGGTLLDLVLPMRTTFVALTFGAALAASLAARQEGLASRVLRSRLMCFIGTRSYGLYVFHGIIAYWMVEHRGIFDALATRLGYVGAMVVQAVAGAGFSVLVAAVSYDLYEKRFLRLKNRLAPSRAAPVLDPRPAIDLTRDEA